MDSLTLFTALLKKHTSASKTTIKNYKADVNHFIKWYESRYQEDFSPEKVTSEIILRYEKTSKQSVASLKKRRSALKSFYDLLEKERFTHHPFKIPKTPPVIDPLTPFKDYLTVNGASDLTTKNYLSDIRTFLAWHKHVAKLQTVSSALSQSTVEEYKQRLLDAKTPISTINRKLSSLRKYADFLRESGEKIPTPKHSNISTAKNPAEEDMKLSLQDLDQFKEEEKRYSKFPPIRLAQKLLSPYFALEEQIAEKIAEQIHEHKFSQSNQEKNQANHPGKQKASLPISNVKSPLYAPLFAPSSTTTTQKILHHAQYTRPKWYRIYHRLPLTHHLHTGLLIITASVVGFYLYQGTFAQAFSQNAPTSSLPPKLLAFQGTLTNQDGSAITDSTSVKFTLYNDEFKTGGAEVWSEDHTVTPDTSGDFTAYLGANTPLNTEIFAQYSNLYLGISVNGGEELTPRQRLANTPYSTNSEFLQGMAPITQAGSGTKNVILTLNSQGNLTIGDASNPVFQATGGNFTIKGQGVILTTNTGSNGDITLEPDGTGKLFLNASLESATDTSHIFADSLHINDSAVLTATTSAIPAFALLQSGSGDIFTASASGSTSFLIDNQGRVGINATSLSEKLQINGSIKLDGSGQRIYGDNLKLYGQSTTDLLLQPTGHSSGNVGIGTESPDAFVHIESNKSDTPLLKLDLTASGSRILDIQKSGTSVFVVSDSGNIGVGTTSTNSRITLPSSTSSTGGISLGDTNLYRAGSGLLKTDDSFEVENNLTVDGSTTLSGLEVNGTITTDLTGTATTNGICHSGAGSDTTANDRELVVCSGAPADIAEWYAAEPEVDEAEIVAITNREFTYDSQGTDPHTGIIKSLGSRDMGILKEATQTDTLFGVVSTGPYQTIGADIKDSVEKTDLKAVPVALAGRVPLKIALTSPSIKPGDPITISEFSGKGTKATQEGIIIGRALESWSPSSGKNTIQVLVSNTYFNPFKLTTLGELEIEKIDDKFVIKQGPTLIEKTQALASLIVGNIQAGSLIAKEVIVKNSLTAAKITSETLTSASVTAGKITTETLSVTQDSLTIAGKSLAEYIDERIAQAQNPQNTANNTISPIVSELNVENSASISGKLTAGSLSTEGDISANSASIAGTLTADRIVAGEIDGLESKIASIASQFRQAEESTGSAPLEVEPIELDDTGLAIYPASKFSFALFTESVTSLGTGTFKDLAAQEQIAVGTGLTLTENSLNSTTQLQIQPHNQAGISFAGGQINFDTQGNITVGGNAVIAGTIAAKDAVFEKEILTPQVRARTLSPLPEEDLAVKLGTRQNGKSQEFQVQNSNGDNVLTIDNAGNLTASGEAKFSKFSFNLIPKAEALSDTQVIIDAPAGKAAIEPYQRELTVYTSHVTKDSLIYLTPAGASTTQVYLLRQSPQDPNSDEVNGSFTVGLNQTQAQVAEFNFLIVN